ncbi:glucosylglycerol 3-phosphatase [Acaryochloris marina]|uniref:Glucosylglycerol 3-phosphatase n=1 Tax=Acaryochloris marina (strain MBIC 11017) TaxID=329726 RepID=B0CB73_ACAM1|nr:glucosylglycerol 3-phosphatase [Acaryochloris marina]ABW26712.1 glucosylglycerol 3-phosphatase [Acaryochloris marina MBIC11017]BDM81493.1 glucosylglycerolphosphate phosphatase [Acaryochloris marina MBIC10699]
MSNVSLSEQAWSLDHGALIDLGQRQNNLLIIQDLDGVCMGLVKDPLTRTLDPAYVRAARQLDGHFYVLTNGEHIGNRGVNRIVEKTFDAETVVQEGLYLPGLAAGGVQWQDRFGSVSHPGVSDQELAFLAAVPEQISQRLQQFFQTLAEDSSQIQPCIQAAVLDNPVSPTANLNVFYDLLADRTEVYARLQQEMQTLTAELLTQAQDQGLGQSFFVHYAPNLGKDSQGNEILQPATPEEAGTTDFQFMLQGGIKEAGVLAILNRYYHQRTGQYPLGADFNARQAPPSHAELVDLVKEKFDSGQMPTLIGVGDTVTSKAIEEQGELRFQRGGSDRNFLHLIQSLGQEFKTNNVVVYVDSSGGEVKNRKPLQLEHILDSPAGSQVSHRVVTGPGDDRDTDDPLTLNVVFPEGHTQYIQCFQAIAQGRHQ